LQVETTDADPLAFVPNVLEAPAGTVVQVDYNNNSSLPHNINFFDGVNNGAPSLGATEVVTGPNAPESVTFTTPAEPGDYFFWCDVHLQSMTGTLRVTP
jgi:plastocyanin